jgi:hypothetical protein
MTKPKLLPASCRKCKQDCKLKFNYRFALAKYEQEIELSIMPKISRIAINSKQIAKNKAILHASQEKRATEAQHTIKANIQEYAGLYEVSKLLNNECIQPFHASANRRIEVRKQAGSVTDSLWLIAKLRQEPQFKPRSKKAIKEVRLTARHLNFLTVPDRQSYNDDDILDLTYTKPVKLSKSDHEAIQKLSEGMYYFDSKTLKPKAKR